MNTSLIRTPYWVRSDLAGILLLILFVFLPLDANAAVRLGQANTSALSTGLVGYWPLDGNTTSWTTNTTRDLSGQNNAGLIRKMSTSTSPVTGKIGQAFRFATTTGPLSNSQCITFTDATAFQLTTEYTLSAWVNQTKAFTAFERIHGVYGGSAPRDIDIEFWSNNQPTLFDRDAGGSLSLSSGMSITDRKWHLVTATRTGNTRSIYVDGVLKNTNSSSNNGAANTRGWGIGCAAADGTPSAAGISSDGLSIDDVRIYNRALSANEVKQLYSSGAANIAHSNSGPNAPLSQGLVGYWTFDGPDTPWTSATAATTKDKSGNNNTGTLTSMSITTSPVAGKVGQALKSDGINDMVNVPNAANLTLGKVNFSASLWVRTSTTTFGTILAWRNHGVGADTIQGLFTVNRSSASPGNIGFETWSWSTVTTRASSTVALNDGRWHHITATYTTSDNDVRYYVDGVLNHRVDQGAASPNTGSNYGVSIGSNTNGSGLQYFTGTVDDVRFYNRTLSANEVMQLYNAGAVNIAHSNTVTLSTGLVGHWTLDGPDTPWTSATAATTKDKSGSGNTGTLTSMSITTSPVAGKIGQALNFDGGNDFVTVPADGTSLDLDGASAVTLSAWIYIDSYETVSPNIRNIAGRDTGASSGQYFLRLGDTGVQDKIQWIINNTVDEYKLFTTSTVSLGRWYHIVGTWNGTTQTVYLNGVGNSQALGGTFRDTNTSFVIGSLHFGVNRFFDGKIDEVRVYNRALSAQEVTQLYNSGR